MSIQKNGVISTNGLFESEGVNLVVKSQIGKSFSYTPNTGNNSCMEGFTVDFTGCSGINKIYIQLDVEWSGFDESNENGDFNIFFQGSTYNVTGTIYDWTGNNMVINGLNNKKNLKELVLSSSPGTYTYYAECDWSSQYPDTRSKLHVGIRSNYSNGTGTIKISNLVVTPEKYYIRSTPPPRKLAIFTDRKRLYFCWRNHRNLNYCRKVVI